MPNSKAASNAAIATFKKTFSKYFNNDKFSEYMKDLVAVWYIYLIMVGISFLLGFVYLIFLKICGSVMIFISMCIPLILFAVGGYMAYSYKDNYIDDQ
jgi:hypothetical protein